MSQMAEHYTAEDIALFQDAVSRLLADHDGAETHRQLREGDCPWDYRQALWEGVCEHGLLPSPASGLDWQTLPLLREVFRAMGDTLAVLPLLDAVLASSLMAVCEVSLSSLSAEQLVSGQQRVVPVALEKAVIGGGESTVSYRNGQLAGTGKASCCANANADAFLVVAAGDSGPVIALVPVSDVAVTYAGVALDASRVYQLTFDGVAVAEAAVCADTDQVQAALQQAHGVANTLIASQLEGLGNAAFQRTLEWLKTREQFGVVIGSFQALQHRAARCFLALEKMKALNSVSLAEIVTGSEAGLQTALQCKVFAAATATTLTAEAIQLHGGIGMTDECDVGFYYKSVHALASRYGSRDQLLDQWIK